MQHETTSARFYIGINVLCIGNIVNLAHMNYFITQPGEYMRSYMCMLAYVCSLVCLHTVAVILVAYFILSRQFYLDFSAN